MNIDRVFRREALLKYRQKDRAPVVVRVRKARGFLAQWLGLLTAVTVTLAAALTVKVPLALKGQTVSGNADIGREYSVCTGDSTAQFLFPGSRVTVLSNGHSPDSAVLVRGAGNGPSGAGGCSGALLVFRSAGANPETYREGRLRVVWETVPAVLLRNLLNPAESRGSR